MVKILSKTANSIDFIQKLLIPDNPESNTLVVSMSDLC